VNVAKAFRFALNLPNMTIDAFHHAACFTGLDLTVRDSRLCMATSSARLMALA